jgi:hypothetical protein
MDGWLSYRLNVKQHFWVCNSIPTGPRGEKPAADVTANAVKAMTIATGEIEEDIDTPETKGKVPAAVSTGKRGGKARVEKTALASAGSVGARGRPRWLNKTRSENT